ncbi:unnamed protein product [Bemisia tabaci]|uniref:Extracellular membrane protein CFEM domain-containing protein n=1 Tax=Bemisia tabaci TaxID=7038 RepID=A0A9P0F809_BEMTA|nr:unnamed protein product [Bemisia tabaci]
MVAQTELLVLCLSVFICRVTCPVTPPNSAPPSPTKGLAGSPTRSSSGSGSPNRSLKRPPSKTLSRTSSRDSYTSWIYPSRMFVNPQIWKSPPYPDTKGDPLCNPSYVAAKFPSASGYCKKECASLSKQAEKIFKTYGKDEALAKTNSRQCSDFVDGVCTNYLNDRVSFCWCLGVDYEQLAIVCRALMEGSRNYVNARIAALNMWEINVRPTLPNMPALPNIPGWVPGLPSRPRLPSWPGWSSIPNIPGAGLVRGSVEWLRGWNAKSERRSPSGRFNGPKVIEIHEGKPDSS